MLVSSSSSSDVPPEPLRRRLRLSDILLHKKIYTVHCDRLKRDQRPKKPNVVSGQRFFNQKQLEVEAKKCRFFSVLNEGGRQWRPPSIVQTCLEACEEQQGGLAKVANAAK